jgi:hypothetical protein
VAGLESADGVCSAETAGITSNKIREQ